MKETEEMNHMSRKIAVTSFFMLCALMLAAAPAFAQVAFSVSSLPQQARFEGLNETMGAVQATNNGAGGVVKAGSSVTVLYSGTIAGLATPQNVLTCSAGVTGTGTVCATGAPSVTVGSVSGGQLTISFGSDTTFATGAYILVSQVRVNVNGLGSAATAVTATLSGTSAAPQTFPLTFTNATVPVAAIVNPATSISLRAGPAVIQTCSVPGSVVPNVLAGGAGFSIRVTERYPAALTSAADETSFTGGATGTYVITNGTTIQVVVSGIPSGLAVQYQGNGNRAATSSSGTTASLTVTPVGTTAAVVSTGAPITFTFVVAADSTSAVEQVTFDFGLGLPAAGSTLAATAGALPPIGTTATVTAAVNIGPIQSAATIIAFATNQQGSTLTVATISDCVTNLLFPYVTNQGGLDTSFSIANTTADATAFGKAIASPQSGPCVLNFWPTTDTTAVAIGTAVFATTPTIPSGALYTFSLSNPAYPFSGQTGYIIAVCKFLNAHAFAFVTSGFASTGSMISHGGYLGLVLPNPIGTRVFGGASEALTQ